MPANSTRAASVSTIATTTIASTMALVAMLCSCGSPGKENAPVTQHGNPAKTASKQAPEVAVPRLDAMLDEAQKYWREGKLDLRDRKVDEAYKFHRKDPFWGHLATPPPPYLRGTRAEVIALWNRAAADPKESPHWLARAREVAIAQKNDELIARTDYRVGYNLVIEGKTAAAGVVFENVVARARKVGDPGLLADSLVTLSVARMRLDRHDEAIAECTEAAKLFESAPDQGKRAILENNLGWSLLRLGNEKEALIHFNRSADLYRDLGPDGRSTEVIVLGNLAEHYLRRGNFAEAEKALNRAVEASKGLSEKARAVVQTKLAHAYVSEHKPDLAREAIAQARSLSKFQGAIQTNEDARIRLVESEIAEQTGAPEADAGYREVAKARVAWSPLRLEAMLNLAHLVGRGKRPQDAISEFGNAENLLEEMRESLQNPESKLSFFEEAGEMYDDYVDFLIGQGGPQHDREALQVADRSRARLLSDYHKGKTALEPLNIHTLQARLKTVDGLALFYWIGSRHAYIWMIDANSFERRDLSAKPGEIRQLARKYFEAVSTNSEMTPEVVQAGVRLRDVLLSPAKSMKRDQRVFMVLDAELGLLNPESLPDSSGHWLIDEAIISVVPSLAFLNIPRPPSKPDAMLLLALGDPVPTPGFEKLNQASEELDTISKSFPANRRSVIRGKDATPAEYLKAITAGYQMIHFTAHGKAEAGNPLDSSVVLSPDPATGVFKLYARDILGLHIRAKLVTISACKSAVSRTYRGEGAVGLAWAFLRAGAGQVVAGLWNVNDEASQELMSRFYTGMRTKNQPPAVALREAKRELIKIYKKPYYWAPFEIFAGYIEQ